MRVYTWEFLEIRGPNINPKVRTLITWTPAKLTPNFYQQPHVRTFGIMLCSTGTASRSSRSTAAVQPASCNFRMRRTVTTVAKAVAVAGRAAIS